MRRILFLDILRQPSDTFAVTCEKRNTLVNQGFAVSLQDHLRREHTLSHDDTAHEQLNGSDTLERDLALARCLIQTQLVPQLVLAHGIRMVNLVAEDEERNLGQFLHGQESVKLGLGFGEPLRVLGIDKEDDAAHLREVVLPQTAG